MTSRPRPPSHLVGAEAIGAAPSFEPAPELEQWARATFIDDGASLHNPEHAHLAVARLGFLWTNVANARHGRRIVGQAEFRPPSGGMGKWARARAEAQILGWFTETPDFLLTFEAQYAADASDPQFCALLEHELYHCGQDRDEFGAPKFHKSGIPVFCIRGHDVEEFVSIVRRYGAGAAHVEAMIEAAARAPEVAAANVAIACGTCGS